MPLGEFALIDRFFRDLGVRRDDVDLGVGDDAAVLACPAGMRLVAAIDTLVEGRHFPPGSPAASIGHRALAVNLSDLAAMGASPAWALLALTLPEAEPAWLGEFAAGFGALARAHGVALVGGDTTAGPLSVTVQLLGFAAPKRALLRSGGRAGDVVFVTGTPGDAAFGLALEIGREAPAGPEATDAERQLRERFLYPTPRVAWGEALVGWASAAQDISDGLAGDLAKLAAASGCGAEIDLERLPLSAALLGRAGRDAAERLALTGGDDYELVFSVPAARLEAFTEHARRSVIDCSAIGRLTAGEGLQLRRAAHVMQFSHSGYEHFS